MVCNIWSWCSLYGVLIIKLMKESLDSIYSNNTIDINDKAFNTDFDNIEWEPKVEDDSDSEAAELYGY